MSDFWNSRHEEEANESIEPIIEKADREVTTARALLTRAEEDLFQAILAKHLAAENLHRTSSAMHQISAAIEYSMEVSEPDLNDNALDVHEKKEEEERRGQEELIDQFQADPFTEEQAYFMDHVWEGWHDRPTQAETEFIYSLEGTPAGEITRPLVAHFKERERAVFQADLEEYRCYRGYGEHVRDFEFAPPIRQGEYLVEHPQFHTDKDVEFLAYNGRQTEYEYE